VDVCRAQPPAYQEIEPGRFVRCHRAAELSLEGIAQ
jgi:hypothetical protein